MMQNEIRCIKAPIAAAGSVAMLSLHVPPGDALLQYCTSLACLAASGKMTSLLSNRSFVDIITIRDRERRVQPFGKVNATHKAIQLEIEGDQ